MVDVLFPPPLALQILLGVPSYHLLRCRQLSPQLLALGGVSIAGLDATASKGSEQKSK